MRIAFLTAVGRRTWLIAGAAVLSLTTVTWLALAQHEPETQKDQPILELSQADVVTVAPQPLERTLRLSGSLAPLRHAVMKAHSVGTIVDMRVQEGQRVRAGALLARVDPRNLQAELMSRTASLRKAEADLVLATKNRDNSVALLKQKLIAQNTFDQTEAAFAAAQAGVESAQAQVQLTEIALHDTEIRADFDGVVAVRHVQAGERVMPDSPIVTLVDLSKMELEALVPVADVPIIQVGQMARFTVDGFGAREFTGHVERINPQAEAGTRSLTVYLTVANTDGALKGGMFADGKLLLERTDPQIALPSGAIRNDDDGQFVLLLQDGVVTRAGVRTATVFAESNLTAIESGVDSGAQVIVVSAPTLKPGVRALVASAAVAKG